MNIKVAAFTVSEKSNYTEDILIKLYVHYHTIVIYTQKQFNEIRSIAYIFTTED